MKRLSVFLKAHPFAALALFFCTVAVAVIGRPSGLYFLCDDFSLVPESAMGRFFQTHLLRPLLYGSLWLDAALWGVNAEGFHLTNLLLHFANSVLVYPVALLLLQRYAPAGRHRAVAFFAALLFWVWGCHAEPLFWISGRVGMLAALFVQLSLLCYFQNGRRYLVPALFFFGAALFTYELSWALPPLLTVLYGYEVYVQRKRSPFWPVLLYWNALTAYLFLRYFVLKGSLAGYEAGNLLRGNYVDLLYRQACLVARVFLPPAENSRVFVAAAGLAACAFLFVLLRLYKNGRLHVLFAALLLGCAAALVFPAVSLGIDTHDTESERYVYPASVFGCLLVVYCLTHVVKQRCWLFVTLAALSAGNLLVLYRASTHYRHASYVARRTVESLNAAGGAEELTFTNLPSQYKGALIFRVGFVKAFPGLLQNRYNAVNVRSYEEVLLPAPIVTRIQDSPAKDSKLYVDFASDTIILR